MLRAPASRPRRSGRSACASSGRSHSGSSMLSGTPRSTCSATRSAGRLRRRWHELRHTRIHRLVLAATSCGWGSVPGDPFATLALVTPSRYYFGPATAAVNALFGARSIERFRDRRCGAPAPSARPDRLLVAAARRARMVVIAMAPPCASRHSGTRRRERPHGARRARPGYSRIGSPTPRLEVVTRREPLLPARRGHTSRVAVGDELPRRPVPRISPTRSWPARSCGRPRAGPASGRS